jgi:effector-binding domain-containing protein
MKALRIILIIVAVIVVIIGILTAIAPTKSAVSRSVVINAPKEVVWNNISHFSNTNKWAPWNEYDPNMKVTIEGTDGTVGAVSRWQGNDQVGEGSQTLTNLDPMKRADMHLNFIKPFKSEADAYTEMNDTGGMVKVTWGFNNTSPRPMNIMNLFMDMDAMLGKEFEKGLNKLKTLSEEESPVSKTYRGYSIKESEEPAKVYVGKRATVEFKNMGKFFGDNLPKISGDLAKAKIEIAGPPSGIFFTYDTVKMNSDMAAVIPVKEVKSSIAGWETFNTPAGKAILVDYYGAYDKAASAYMAIDDYMMEKGLKPKEMVIEEYVTDPMVEKDTAKWLTRIYYYIQ